MPRSSILAVLLIAASVPAGLARSSVSGGRSLAYTRELVAMGPRLTGSPAYERAAEWCVGRFRDAGIARVSMERFDIDRGWERISASARIVAPVDRPLHAASLGWMPSTPEGGIDAEVAVVESFSSDAIASQRSLRGRIALLPEGDPPGNADALSRTAGAVAALRAAGAVALLSPDSDPANVLTARGLAFTTTIGALPAAQIGHDDARELRRLVAAGGVRVALDIVNRVTPGRVSVSNVVAEIAGAEERGEWVLVGAHLDSWDFGPGAQDNATGAAMVLEAARAIASLPAPPRRTIRFALWGGEEQGQLGSTAYARAHAFELDQLVAVLNTDAGTGRVIGWTAPGRPDVIRAVRPLTRGFLDDLGAGTFDDSLRYAFQSDGAPFILAGVPALDLNADDTRYEEIHHKAADTIDRVDPRSLAIGGAVVAATAQAIADARGRVGQRLDPRGVQKMRKRGE